MIIRAIQHAELSRLFENHTTKNEDGVVYYQGFDLMRPDFFADYKYSHSAEHGCQFLVCLIGNQPAGILKFKRYALPDHKFVPETASGLSDSYLAVRFVDVHADHRQQGIARELNQAFAARFPETFIVGGKATPSGKRAHIHRWMREPFGRYYYVSEIDLVDDWEEENAW